MSKAQRQGDKTHGAGEQGGCWRTEGLEMSLERLAGLDMGGLRGHAEESADDVESVKV